jgi:hypothetical protein
MGKEPSDCEISGLSRAVHAVEGKLSCLARLAHDPEKCTAVFRKIMRKQESSAADVGFARPMV